jgi:putative effector of murein hydrolase LrgA (UPF0299 family)
MLLKSNQSSITSVYFTSLQPLYSFHFVSNLLSANLNKRVPGKVIIMQTVF